MIASVAWMTPWNAQSAIATFSAGIVAELRRRGCRVQIIRTEIGEDLEREPLPDAEPVLALARVPDHEIVFKFDALVANIGDHAAFHGALPAFMDRHPVFGIFHDGFLANLAAGWFAHVNGAEASTEPWTEAIYGDSGRGQFWLPLPEMAAGRPMLEWLAPMVSGAAIHSNHWAERLRQSCTGEVLVQPLAMPEDHMPPPRPHGDRLVIASIGHVNANRQVDQVLYALARHDELRERCELRLIGPVTERVQAVLTRLAADLNVPPPVFTGWLEEGELRRNMASVDVLCCLRYPLLEAGSASLITAMRSGRAVLVSNHGAYADVPGDLVYRCKPGFEAVDILRHLLAIRNDPAAAAERGARARQYAREVNTPRGYVDGLLPALEKATAAAPAVMAARHLGRQLGRWRIPPESPVGERLANALAGMLFGAG